MSEDCLGARFEILLDGKTQHCRVTMNTAMGAANIIQRQNSNAGEKFRMLVTLICSPLTTMAPRAGYLNRSCDRAKSVRVRPAPRSARSRRSRWCFATGGCCVCRRRFAGTGTPAFELPAGGKF